MSLEEKKELVRPFVYVRAFVSFVTSLTDDPSRHRSATIPRSSRIPRFVCLAPVLLLAAANSALAQNAAILEQRVTESVSNRRPASVMSASAQCLPSLIIH